MTHGLCILSNNLQTVLHVDINLQKRRGQPNVNLNSLQCFRHQHEGILRQHV